MAQGQLEATVDIARQSDRWRTARQAMAGGCWAHKIPPVCKLYLPHYKRAGFRSILCLDICTVCCLKNNSANRLQEKTLSRISRIVQLASQFLLDKLHYADLKIRNFEQFKKSVQCIMKYTYLLVFLLLCKNSFSQPQIILEACNKIENPSDRLTCFNEVIKIKSALPITSKIDSEQIAIDRTKKTFIAFQEVIKNGVSLNNYKSLIEEPIKEVGLLKLELRGEMPHMIGTLDEVIRAYKDAEILWHASIYESQDGGIFVGKILNPETTGLSRIVEKYNLPTEKKLLNRHLSFEIAIQKIWNHAEHLTRKAFFDQNSSTTNSDEGDILNSNVFRPLKPIDKKCKDKYDIFYDSKVCNGN